MQLHKIQLVENDQLPKGQDWAVVEHAQRITVFITEDALTPRKLEEAWAAYRMLASRPPRPRRARVHSEVGHLRTVTAVLLAAYGLAAMKVGSAIL